MARPAVDPGCVSRLHRNSAPALLPTAPARSARLLFSDGLADGRLADADLARADTLRALTARPVPPLPIRYAERIGMKRDPDWFERRSLAPLLSVREAVLGDAAPAPPRFLVRVDEYPLAGAYDDGDPRLQAGFERFHRILADAGVPYLMAVCPAVSRDYLEPSGTDARPLSTYEIAELHRMGDDGVEFALHGFDHRTRQAHPRRHSELSGLEPGALAELLDRGMERLDGIGLDPRVFVPPFNRFDAAHYDVLAERFDVVCGGPESVPLLGFHPTPLWRGDAAYLPAYAPFYGPAATVAAAVRRAVEAQQGVWIPVVLHWSWEIGAWEGMERLAEALAGHAHTWSSFVRAAESPRSAPLVAPASTSSDERLPAALPGVGNLSS